MAVNATVDQFRAAFAGLNKLERIGLAQLARRMASGASGYTSGEDLLSEAVVRTFIANAMRSIVFAARDSKEMSARDFSFDLDERLSPSPDAWQHGPPTPEEICLRRERRDLGLAAIDFAREALRQDTEALNVLEGLAADMSAEETRAQLGIDLQTYKAARERVRYRLKDWNEGKPQ
jgi:hypothetical protein